MTKICEGFVIDLEKDEMSVDFDVMSLKDARKVYNFFMRYCDSLVDTNIELAEKIEKAMREGYRSVYRRTLREKLTKVDTK